MPFKKGEIANPNGRPVGAKGKATLLQEERRAIFEQRVSERWEKTIDELPAVYIADQFMGKAKEVIEHQGKIETVNLTPEIIEAAKAELKKRMNAE